MMTTLAEVKLWGTTIGAVSLEEGQRVASFQYTPEFVASNIQVAPLTMVLRQAPYSFPALSLNSFHGLPGLLADSLPDKFGHALIDAWLATQGRTVESFNAVERLCYTGSRGMGALEFEPLKGPRATTTQLLKIDSLVELASDILSRRERLSTTIIDRPEALQQILRVGTSAGGARAKAVIAWNSETNEVRSGQVKAPPGFGYWLLKFDGVSGNKDKERADPKGFGAIEYAYYLMAQDAGIKMPECRLLEENGRCHFMAKRFDRTDWGDKYHMLTLAGMAHLDFNEPAANSYEQVFLIMRRLGLPMAQIEEMFRRMVFNIVARNQDDHVKNTAFFMDRKGTWSLTPAYDVTYSYNPQGFWTSQHQMSMNTKRKNFEPEDFIGCGKTISLRRGRAMTILDEVQRSVKKWPYFAEKARVTSARMESILRVHRFWKT